MKNERRIRQAGLFAFVLFAVTGCAQNATVVNKPGSAAQGTGTHFVYKPGPAAQGAAGHPAKVAVLAFRDGTEDFTQRGSVFNPETLVFNQVKGGIPGIIDTVPPEYWAKSFAEELASSGTFRSARFVYSASELVDESHYIEGTVRKAYATSSTTIPSEYAVDFRAFRRSDRAPVWERQVTRSLKSSPEPFKGCGRNIQCMADISQAEMNRLMQGMFAEAGEDFVAALGGKPTSASSPEALDATIDKILKEK